MAFSICFTNHADYIDEDNGDRAAVGRITIGEFEENFHASLFEWEKQTYETQWLHSLERFLAGAKSEVLITFYVNPKDSSNLEWWALYRGEGDTVHVQNQLLFYNQLDREFSVAEASSFLSDRRTVSEDGDPISEWHIALGDLESFCKQMKHMNNAPGEGL
jgi:hypothetical protein